MNSHITGFSDKWLVKDREWNFLVRGFIAGDGDVAVQNVNLLLSYKNSNVIQSWHTIAFPTITKNTFTLSVAHPEAWEIYMGGAWPLLFMFKMDSIYSIADMAPTNGIIVALSHSRLIPQYEVWNFIASTCDFSMNTVDQTEFKTAWGERNNCFPLNTDLEYLTASAVDFTNT